MRTRRWFATISAKILSAIFKDAAPTGAARVWSDWLARPGGEILSDVGALIPIPLQRARMILRCQTAIAGNQLLGVILTFTGVVLLEESWSA